MVYGKNLSGCSDPTASEAIGKVDKQIRKVDKLVQVLKSTCDLAGFQIEGRVVLKDKKTGEIWK